MNKLLWISYCAPYARVAHAGGKNHYYWLKTILEDKQYEVTLITFCTKEEKKCMDEMNYQFDCRCYVSNRNKVSRLKERALSILMAPYSLYCYAGCVAMYKILYARRQVLDLKKSGYQPDSVLLHWTQMGFLWKFIHKVFPETKIIVMEEDVSFLRTKREKEASGGVRKIVKSVIHNVMLKRELEMCRKVDSIIVTNSKDSAILSEQGIAQDKIKYVVSYYDSLCDISRAEDSKSILFYGAMNRNENVEAAVWFAKYVMPQVREMDDFRFVIMGGNPVKEIKDLENDYIIVTGFVDDIRPYFENAMCMVAPLFGGAGIKIKILEGMSSGIPVLTNAIGIEGIIANNRVEYCHCDSVDDYVQCIIELNENRTLAQEIGNKGSRLVSEKFNPRESIDKFKETIKGTSP